MKTDKQVSSVLSYCCQAKYLIEAAVIDAIATGRSKIRVVVSEEQDLLRASSTYPEVMILPDSVTRDEFGSLERTLSRVERGLRIHIRSRLLLAHCD